MSTDNNLSVLLGDAGLDDAATSTMQLTADTLGPAIQAGLGDVTIDDVSTSELVLVTQLIDDSSSIRFVTGNTEAVRDGSNTILDALGGSKQSASVLISCRYLNGNRGTHGVLYPYRPLSGAERLTASNYNPSGGTPLYDQAAVTLTAVAAKMAEFEQGGVSTRAVTAIVTDGADVGSRSTAHDVQKIVRGLLATEAHIIAGMGISDAPSECHYCHTNLKMSLPKKGKCPSCNRQVGTDFEQVFEEMGLLPEWILTPANTPHDIREAFAVVSQSAVRASQAAGSFSQVALGGFGG